MICPAAHPAAVNLAGVNPGGANFPNATTANVLHRDLTMADACHLCAMIADILSVVEVAADAENLGATPVAVA